MKDMSDDRHKNYCQFDALSNKGKLSNVKIRGSQGKVKHCHSKGVVSEVELISLKLYSYLNNE